MVILPPRLCPTILLATLTAAAVSAAPWKFAVMGDGRTGGENGNTSGVNEVTVHAIAAEAVAQGVKFVIFPGDLVNGNPKYGPLADQFTVWKRAMAPLIDAKIPLHIVRGNHDVAANQDKPKGTNLAAWRAAFPDAPQNGPAGQEGLTYRVDYENVCVIANDQFVGKQPGFDSKVYDSKVNGGMVSPWVLEQVKASKADWVFVFGHTAAYIGHHRDCLANVPEERDALFDALGTRGVYFGGHDHMYVRQVVPNRTGQPVLTVVVGDAGASPQFYDNSGLNAEVGTRVVPKTYFLNAKPDNGEKTVEEVTPKPEAVTKPEVVTKPEAAANVEPVAKAESVAKADAARKSTAATHTDDEPDGDPAVKTEAVPKSDAPAKAPAPPVPPFGPKVENTNGHPMYFGYLLVTVDGPQLTGEWRAFVNYTTKTMTPPPADEAPRFETLDRFTWPATP
jgi:hypothetical protein